MICGGLSDKDRDLGKKALKTLNNYDELRCDFKIGEYNISYDQNKGVFHSDAIGGPRVDPETIRKTEELKKLTKEKRDLDNEINVMEREMLLKLANVLVLAELHAEVKTDLNQKFDKIGIADSKDDKDNDNQSCFSTISIPVDLNVPKTEKIPQLKSNLAQSVMVPKSKQEGVKSNLKPIEEDKNISKSVMVQHKKDPKKAQVDDITLGKAELLSDDNRSENNKKSNHKDSKVVNESNNLKRGNTSHVKPNTSVKKDDKKSVSPLKDIKASNNSVSVSASLDKNPNANSPPLKKTNTSNAVDVKSSSKKDLKIALESPDKSKIKKSNTKIIPKESKDKDLVVKDKDKEVVAKLSKDKDAVSKKID